MARKRYRPFTDGRLRRAVLAALAALVLLCPSGVRADSFDDGGLLRLINRWEMLPKDYAPDDLILPEVPTNKESQRESIYMRPAAAAALEEMFAAAEEAGYRLLAVSGYRSYGTQSLLFKNKVNATGSVERAQKTVAPAGASEHQSGLAMDVVSSNFRYLNRLFLQTDEGKWVSAHCCEFGFIVRYKEGWTAVTGCNQEPWHIRYLGVEHATAVTALDIPYETYAAQARTLPEYVLTLGTSDLFIPLIRDMIAGSDEMAQDLRRAEAQGEDAQWAALLRVTEYYALRVDPE